MRTSTLFRLLGVGLLVLCGWLVAGQIRRNLEFNRRLDRQIQPWAVDLLSLPASEYLSRAGWGSGRWVKREYVPEFLGRVYGLRFAKDGVPGVRWVDPRGKDRWFFKGNEPCLVVSYGGGFMPLHGYIVGHDSLNVWDFPVQKVQDGVFRFRFSN